MLNIAICDDDIQTTGQIEMMIQKIAKRNFADVDIEVFWNGESLADSVVAGDGYDIIYLDIEMNNEDGISTAKRIRKYDKNVLIIYVTSHENYMKESFSVRPFQFLVKPVSEKQMETCFMAAYEDINSGDFYFRYSYQRMNHKVLIRDILYFESSKRKVFIVTREETFTVIVTLFAVTITYEGMWWNKCVFVITFNAIWMLMETLSNYVLMIYCEQYASIQPIGSFVSKSFFLAVIIALKKVFTDDEIKELSVRYSIMLVLIPM